MAAGLGFKTFTTGEVLTAADTNGYLMQGILVFASAAARDSAITSPQEGQFAYLKDTNVTTYYTGSAWANVDTTGMTNPRTTTGDTIYSSSGSTPARLGIGSTGQVLTVASGIPSWATPASGGGMTLLSTTSCTGASVTVSSISQSYKNLLIIGKGIYLSTATDLVYQLNGDTGNNYTRRYVWFNAGSVSSGNDTGQPNAALAQPGTGSAYNTMTKFVMNIYRYTETEYKMMDVHSTGTPSAKQDGFPINDWNNTAAITSITFVVASGTFSGGTIYIYGVN
jgi:hypothetical protein